MKASTEFKIGKHNIGYVNSTFVSYFKDASFDKQPAPTFQKLLRSMTDVEIELELSPGFCALGDIIAFLDNAPEETKDGWANLFYMEPFVVHVYWHSGSRRWGVSSWDRNDDDWYDGGRVFAPATGSSSPVLSEASETQALLPRIEKLEAWMNLVKGS